MRRKVEDIFPTSIHRSRLDRVLTKEELNIVSNCEVYNNKYNSTSKNTYILEEDAMKDIKKHLTLAIEDYYTCISGVDLKDNKLEPYITQSWLNFNLEGQIHHEHYHPNSILSGVLFIQADTNLDRITFLRDRKIFYEFKTKRWNKSNATRWDIPVHTGEIVIFPSYLHHKVEPHKGDYTRISLAFNSFIKGNLGDNKGLTELKL
jgi:uncharacterized protein (TIGR02466 family)